MTTESQVPASGADPLPAWAAAFWLTVLVCAAIAGAWQDFTLGWLNHEAETGYLLQGGVRLLGGETPCVDFLYQWSPFTAALMAGSFRLFGVNLWAAKLPMALFVAAIPPLAYLWVRPVASRMAALVAATTVWAFCPIQLRLPYPTMFTFAPALFVFIHLDRMRPDRLLGPAWWAGLGVGLTLAMKHNIGILLGIALWVRLFCTMPFPEQPLRGMGGATRRLGPVLRLAGLAVVLGALAALYSKFDVPRQTSMTVLGPATLLTVLGTARAVRRDRGCGGALHVRALVGPCVAVVGAVVLMVAPWVAWLAHRGALDEFLEFGLILRPEGGQDWGAVYGMFIRPVGPGVATALLAGAGACCVLALRLRRPLGKTVAMGATVAFVVLIFAVDGPLAGQRVDSFAPWALFGAPVLLASRTDLNGRVFSMLTAAAWLLVLAYPAAHAHSLGLAVIPALAVAVALGWRRTQGQRTVHRWAVMVLAGAVVAQGWAEWGTALLTREEGRWRVVPLARVPGERGGTWTDEAVAQRYGQMLAALDAAAPPGTPLLAWPSLGILNFLSARPNPTVMDYFWPGLLDRRREAETLALLQAAPPPVAVLRTNADAVFGSEGYFLRLHPSLYQQIQREYTRMAALGDWTLLVHMAAPPRAPEQGRGRAGPPYAKSAGTWPAD